MPSSTADDRPSEEYATGRPFAPALVTPEGWRLLCLFGRPRYARDGRDEPIALQPKGLALLAYLALAGGPVPRHELADLLFPGAADPRATLRWHLSHLKAGTPPELGDSLRATREAVALAVPTDVALFSRLVAGGVDGHDPGAALPLFAGDLLAGLTVSASADFDDWLYVQQEAARRLFRQAVVSAVRRARATSSAVDLSGPLARLVSVDPYFEEGHRLLIGALEAGGRSVDAAAAFRRYHHLVRDDLGAEPPRALAARYGAAVGTGRPPPVDGLVGLRDVTLHVVDWEGGDPPLLAIHGSTMSGYALTALCEQLAPRVRVVAPDLRGHGFSDKPPSDYGVERHAQDLLELMSRMGLDRPVVVGFSMGGAIATAMAVDAPVGGLVLLDGVVGNSAFAENAAARTVSMLQADVSARFGGLAEYLARLHKRRIPFSSEAERVVERMGHYELVPTGDGTLRRRAIRRALEETWLSLAARDSLAELARVACPVLVVHAALPFRDATPYLPAHAIDDQLRAAPHAEHFVARRSDHAMLVRDPEAELVEAILDFAHRCRAVRAVVGDPVSRAGG
jgi:pimeloyl-ACP methyl ester carboxylesterase/DNA-binding SARP family transcriptional activator